MRRQVIRLVAKNGVRNMVVIVTSATMVRTSSVR
jgi:hypothetical protein